MYLVKKISAVVVMSIFVVSLFSGVNAEIVITKPSPKQGSFWSYDYRAGPITATQTFTLTGTSDINVQGTNYNVYVLAVTISGNFNDGINTGTFSMQGIYYITTQDMASVKSYWQERLEVTGMGITTTVESYCNSTSQPPVKEFDFPLKVGKSWSYTATTTTDCQSYVNGAPSSPTHDTSTDSRTWNVVAEEKVSVPAGTFDTLHLKDNDSPANELWISSDVGFYVKEVGENLNLELKSYKYESEPPPPGNNLPGPLGESSTMLMIIIAVIVIIAVVSAVVVVLWMKKKKKVSAPPPQLTFATTPAPPSTPVQPPTQPSPPQAPTPAPSQVQVTAQPKPSPPQPAQAPPSTAICPTCSSPLRIIPEYNRWYCDKCAKYW